MRKLGIIFLIIGSIGVLIAVYKKNYVYTIGKLILGVSTGFVLSGLMKLTR